MIAFGNLVALFTEKLVGDRRDALLVQHTKANLPIYGDWDFPYRDVDQSYADVALPGGDQCKVY